MISMTELIRNVDKEIKLADPDLISPNLIEGWGVSVPEKQFKYCKNTQKNTLKNAH